MQISFDPRDPAQLSTVARIVDALSGGNAFEPVVAGDGDAALAFEAPKTTAAPVPPRGDADDSDDEGNDTAAVAPSPTPATPAPAAPAAPAQPEGVETDANGLPWDKRIHSGPADKRPKNADGSWRKKRGVTDDEVAAVEAELKQIMAADGTPAQPAAGNETAPAAPPATPPAAEVADVTNSTVASPPAAPTTPPVPVAPAPTAAPAAPVPTPPAAPAAQPGPDVANATPDNPPAAPAAEAPTFASVMKRVTSLQTAGKLTVDETAALATGLGLTAVKDLLQRPDLLPAFSDSLAAYEQGAA